MAEKHMQPDAFSFNAAAPFFFPHPLLMLWTWQAHLLQLKYVANVYNEPVSNLVPLQRCKNNPWKTSAIEQPPLIDPDDETFLALFERDVMERSSSLPKIHTFLQKQAEKLSPAFCAET